MRALIGLVFVLAVAGCGTDPDNKARPTTSTSTATSTPQLTRAQADQKLLRAAASGDTDAARIALSAGANTEIRDARKRTPLLLAATHDHVEVAKLLVKHGADPDALDDRA